MIRRKLQIIEFTPISQHLTKQKHKPSMLIPIRKEKGDHHSCATQFHSKVKCTKYNTSNDIQTYS